MISPVSRVIESAAKVAEAESGVIEPASPLEGRVSSIVDRSARMAEPVGQVADLEA